MLKFVNYDIVFSEIPDEVTLAVNISGCPNHCKGCHSPWLWKDSGDILDEVAVCTLLHKYGDTITCFCLMGGDNDPKEVERIARFVHFKSKSIKVGWYSGKSDVPSTVDMGVFQYVKVGGYKEECGSLRSPATNQRLYRIDVDHRKEDITYRFWK